MFDASPTTEVLARAIDACAMRQAVYSANIANANVEGYRRMEVWFDQKALHAEITASPQALRDASHGSDYARPQVVMSADATVKLDEEMALMARNALRYQTLLSAYSRSMALLQSAVKEGRE